MFKKWINIKRLKILIHFLLNIVFENNLKKCIFMNMNIWQQTGKKNHDIIWNIKVQITRFSGKHYLSHLVKIHLYLFMFLPYSNFYLYIKHIYYFSKIWARIFYFRCMYFSCCVSFSMLCIITLGISVMEKILYELNLRLRYQSQSRSTISVCFKQLIDWVRNIYCCIII